MIDRGVGSLALNPQCVVAICATHSVTAVPSSEIAFDSKPVKMFDVPSGGLRVLVDSAAGCRAIHCIRLSATVWCHGPSRGYFGGCEDLKRLRWGANVD